MSVTTSTNTTTQSILHVLTDYDLHHSGNPQNPSTPEPPNQNTAPHVENPPGWDRDHRRVPPYRPINRNLDLEQRPRGVNVVEVIFIATMLNGCRLTANVNSMWRATGGRINDRIFRYAIGGEW